MTSPAPVRIVAAVIRNTDGHVLVVRKRGSNTFIQPGGKREVGETSEQTLMREVREELGVHVIENSLLRLGAFSDNAVHEVGRRVEAEVFACQIHGEPCAQNEIEALAWVDPAQPSEALTLAPLSKNHILPCVARGA